MLHCAWCMHALINELCPCLKLEFLYTLDCIKHCIVFCFNTGTCFQIVHELMCRAMYVVILWLATSIILQKHTVCRAASSVASVLPRGCWRHEVPLKQRVCPPRLGCKEHPAGREIQMQGECRPPCAEWIAISLRTWKYIRIVLCNSNTMVFDHTLQIVLGNTKYFTLSLVRVCKALPCRFWGWLPKYRKCQHLENFVV